jgi:glycosidase
MKHSFLILALAGIAANGADASILKISANSEIRLTGAEVEGNYSTTHLYVDEIAGDAIPMTVFFDPQAVGIETCEVFTNLNRRDRAGLDANGDGTEDGILPVNGNAIAAGDDGNYYKAYSMNPVSGGYQLTLVAAKTGAYRLTARYRFNGEPAGTWHYYNDESAGGMQKRDHCIVVSPKKARDIVLYEVNPLTIIAEGTLPSQRGTFADLAGGLGAGHAPRFSLNYVKSLGANTLWFQPIHPNGIDGRQIDPATGQPYEVGSPYAVKNFFEVMPLMAKGFTPGGAPATNDTPAGRTQAMAEFQGFCGAADEAGVDVMLDAPFNHASYDVELAAAGQTSFGNGGSTAASEIRNVEARFFSRKDAYDMRASGSGNIALAPDRTDFGKFADTYDVYFGRYAALVSGSTGGFQNEGDWFDSSIGDENSAGGGNGHFDTITRNVWRYFAGYTLYWLDRTGYPANEAGASLDSSAGIDSLRADFGQGLPPQCWEYIINKTRTRKWNFSFMAESLDGGAVTYRSSRHFDILNENIVFPLHAAQNTSDFRGIYENRRSAYGQALVLLNTSSHDEDHYKDPWQAAIRYAVNSSIDGVPLIFPGQELGLSGTVVPPGDTQAGQPVFGYDRYEVNFGKPIPHFKKYNSLMPLWLSTTPGGPSFNYGNAQLAKVYEGIGQARRFSRALRSSNRYFLNLQDNTPHGHIFSVAKFENRNAEPNASDVVFAFVNLARDTSPATAADNKFNVNIDADGDSRNDFGIRAGRMYNVKNIAAYLGVDSARRDQFLIPVGVSGAELLSQGLYVGLNRVPVTDAAWASAPYEAQYLKLYDVTPPPALDAPIVDMAAFGTVIGNDVTFRWSPAADPEGGISGYEVRIGTTPGGNELYDGSVPGNEVTVSAPYGVMAYATVRQVSAAGIAGGAGSASVLVLEPAGDEDGDGQSNGAEFAAGTNPLDAASALRVASIGISGTDVNLSVATVVGKTYLLETSSDLAAGSWEPVGGAISAVSATTEFTHSGGAGEPRRFYRARVVADR